MKEIRFASDLSEYMDIQKKFPYVVQRLMAGLYAKIPLHFNRK